MRVFGKLTAISQNLSPGLRKIIGNVGWLFAERVLTMVITFFVGVYVIRYLGAENFGRLSYGVSFVALFAAIAQLGLNQLVVRDIVREEKATSEILGTAFLFKLVASLVTIALIDLANSRFNSGIDDRAIVSLVAIGLVFTAFDTIEFWFQSQVLAGILAILRSVQLIFSSLVKLFLIALHFPLMAFVWLLLVEQAVKALGMIFLYLKYRQSIVQWRVNWSRGIEMLKDSWPLILSGVMVTIYLKIDQVMLGNLSNALAVGNYAAAIRFSEIWYFIPIAVCSSVFPAILQAKQRNQDEYYARLQQLYDLMAWLSILIALPMTIFSVPLMVKLLGQEYTAAGRILSWHIWASPFVFLGVARSNWLLAENFTRYSFLTTALGAIVNVGLNLWLIPVYQGVGAAIATTIAYAIASHLTCFLYFPMFKTGWMLTKALAIPFRFNQNMIYWKKIRKKIFSLT